MGHVVSEQGTETNPAKIKAVKVWPLPKNVKEVHSFLGHCTYDNGCGIFWGFPKAFHILNHQILLDELFKYAGVSIVAG